ncbi:MAG TPA: ABC transporter permease, partial [Bacteroidales bacterium]|nr:ABC transporter permease [Bacteroidales bacterium]
MLINSLKISIRSILNNKVFSLINIFGLSVGIGTCILIILFIKNELSYDRFNKDANRIVRVVFRGSVQGEKMNEAHVMPPVAKTLKAEFPEVEKATRLRNGGIPKVGHNGKVFMNSRFAFVDSNFLTFFTLPLITGNPATALIQPGTIVISQSAATKYFGKENAVGKTLHFKDQDVDFTITGVMKDIPKNSHFHFDMLGAMSTFPESTSDTWMQSEFHTYLLLTKGYNYKDLEAKLSKVFDKYVSPQLQEAMGMNIENFRKAGNDLGLFLQPLTDIHLHSDTSGNLEPGGDTNAVYIFGVNALLMLLIACINFMNLSTAGASKKVKGVGVRKVLGSSKRMLIGQFMTESILLTFLATILALFFVELSIPFFNELSGNKLDLSFSLHSFLIPGLLLFTLLVGMLAGSYPSFFLSSHNPVAVLKGAKAFAEYPDKRFGVRSGLVVVQFMVSISLIICTFVVFSQLQFIRNKKLGYDKEQVMVIPDIYVLGNSKETFRQEVLQNPEVLRVSISGYLPVGQSYNNNFFIYPDNDAALQIKTLRYDVDENYIPTLNIQMLEGRNFSSLNASDSASIILNESAVKALGWNKNVLGRYLTHSDNAGVQTTYQVVGVVRDFHFKSLHMHISPLVMVYGKTTGSMIIKAKTVHMANLVSDIQNKWTKLAPEEPFRYSFLDEEYSNAYRAEERLGLIIGIFAGLTIFVACLGLLGLALYTAERRRKEIGIRKVNGSKNWEVIIMLNKDFIKWVALAFVIACPIAWFAMH